MFVLSHFIQAFTRVLDLLLGIYFWIIVIRALISWVGPDPYNPVVRFLHGVTEPILEPLRRRIPQAGLKLDLSPMVVLLIIYFLRSFIISTLYELAGRLR